MNKIEIFTHINKYGQKKNLFKIRLKNGFVYMNIGYKYLGDESVDESDKIIIIDSCKFLELWKNDPSQSEKYLAFGNESIWRKDYKFHHAETGFSSGIDNPVPLAYVHCYLDECSKNFSTKLINMLVGKKNVNKKIPYCNFTDGITRTIWLLSNGAECFPVMTDHHS